MWNQTEDTYDPTDYELQRGLVDGPLILSGKVRQIEFSELLATLPPKPQVDRLIRQFFDCKTFGLPTHRKTWP